MWRTPSPWGDDARYSAQQLMLLYGALDPEIVELSEHDAYRRMSQTPYKAASAQARKDAIRADAERADEPSSEAQFAASEAAAEANKQLGAKLRRTA
jgi:hypothetical protein